MESDRRAWLLCELAHVSSMVSTFSRPRERLPMLYEQSEAFAPIVVDVDMK